MVHDMTKAAEVLQLQFIDGVVRIPVLAEAEKTESKMGRSAASSQICLDTAESSL